MKVHIGCGTVYLRGWVNVDIQAPDVYLAKDRPDLLALFETDESEYYARHTDKTIEKLRVGPLAQASVCDEYGTFDNLPGSTWQVDEILARQVFEHLSIGEAHKALDEVEKKLNPGGILRIDVPDHEATLQKFKETGDDFYIRHLLGPRRNDFGYHMMSYTREKLIKLVEEHGLICIGEEPNIHFYPAFCLRFRKHGFLPAWAMYMGIIERELKTLEIGPGSCPWPRADAYVDISDNHLKDAMRVFGGNKKYINYDINNKLPIDSKEYDFVYCSHVLEHVKDPVAVAKEISRVAKSGVIVVPTLVKEALMLFEERDHKFWFLPSEKKDELLCVSLPAAFVDNLRDIDAQKATCRVMRTGPNDLGRDQRILRKWFYSNEKNLDAVISWKGGFSVKFLNPPA